MSSTPSRGRGARRAAAALFLSLLLHGGALAGLEHAARLPQPKVDRIVDVEIRDPPPRPPAPPLPLPPPPKPKIIPAVKVERHVPKDAPPPPPQAPPPTLPPPNRPPASRPAAPAPIHIGVSLESTVSGGDFAAAVGNTLYGAAPKVAPAPATASRPYWAAKYVAPYQVAELPVLEEDFKAPYPPEARKLGVEGEVVMMLTIDAAGKVAAVKRLSGPGHGLDEAAVAAAHRFRFKPAKLHGEAVATEIRYVYSFEIE
ncbi:MAG: energy transducer TonB [Myxococcales bacterium]